MELGSGSKRKREDAQLEPNKKIKISSEEQDNNNKYIDILPDDVVQYVFLQSAIRDLGQLGQVCKKWVELIRRKSFWRLFAIHSYGADIVPIQATTMTGAVEYDNKEYLLPTIKEGDKKYIDWLRYVKLRSAMEYLLDALDHHYIKSKRKNKPENNNGDDEDNDQMSDEGNNAAQESNELDVEAEHEMSDKSPPENDNDNEPDDHNESEEDSESKSEVYEEGNSDYWTETSLAESLAEITQGELITPNIIRVLDEVSHSEYCHGSPKRLPLAKFNFVYELVPLFIEVNMKKRVKQCIIALTCSNYVAYLDQSTHCVPSKPRGCSYLVTYIERFFEIYEWVKDSPRLRTRILHGITSLLPKLTEVTDTTKKLFKSTLVQLVEIVPAALDYDWSHSNDYGYSDDEELQEFHPVEQNVTDQNNNAIQNKDDEDDKLDCDLSYFRYPSLRPETQLSRIEYLLSKSILDSDALYEILFEVISHYYAMDHWQKKALALQLLTVIGPGPDHFALKVFPLACDAIKHPHNEVVFAGHVALYALIMYTKLVKLVTEEQVLTAVDAITGGIFDLPRSGLFFINELVCLLDGRGSIVDNERLDQLNKSILLLLSKPLKIFNPTVNKHEQLWSRFSQYLPQYHDAIVALAGATFLGHPGNLNNEQSIVSRERILAQYLQLGMACLGDKFQPQAEELIQQVTDKTIGFEVDMRKFQALFYQPYINIYKRTGNVEKAIPILLDYFSQNLFKFGNSVDGGRMRFQSAPPAFIPRTMEEWETARDKFESSEENLDRKDIFKQFFTFESIRQNSAWEPQSYWFNFDSMLAKLNNQYLDPLWRLIMLIGELKEKILPYARRTLDLMLGVMRIDPRFVYCDVTGTLFNLLKPSMSERERERYAMIVAHTLTISIRSYERYDKEDLEIKQEAYLNLFNQAMECVEERLTSDVRIIEDLFAYMLASHHLSIKDLELLSMINRLMVFSPSKTYYSICSCPEGNKLFELDVNQKPVMIERLRVISLLGMYFGVNYLKGIAKRQYDFKILRDLCVSVLRTEEINDEATIDLNELAILLSAYLVDNRVGDLCVFNAQFFDEQLWLEALTNQQFSTGIDELDTLAKSTTIQFFDLAMVEKGKN